MNNELTCDPPLETGANEGSAHQAPALQQRIVIAGVVVGRLVGLEHAGGPIVDFPGNTSGEPLVALSVVELTADEVGLQVILMFEEGDPLRPMVMGLVHRNAASLGKAAAKRPRDVVVDGERLILTAQKEIVLCCGKASITLTRSGKILLRGAYLLNRSSGVNRIKGASVQIN